MTAATTARDHDPYFELVRRLPHRPIQSDDELDRAIAMVDELVVREDLAPGERDYLDVLSDLIHGSAVRTSGSGMVRTADPTN